VRRVSVPSDTVVTVGAGDSVLIDDLVQRGYRDIVAIDVSALALERLAARLEERFGDGATVVAMTVADVRHLVLDRPADVWHDRAVFHFLVEPGDRAAYVERAAAALRPGGYVVIGTFALDGPERCSGLPVARYDAHGLAAAFGSRFELLESTLDTHVTPWGGEQRFQHAVLRRLADSDGVRNRSGTS
jgi:uncharacterized SAM-dependent methyltransferase